MGKAKIGVALVVLLTCGIIAGYLAGKRSVPARVETRTVTKEVVKWREKIVKVESQTANQSQSENVKLVTRWRTLPSGEKVVEQSKEKVSTASTATRSESSGVMESSTTSSRAAETTRVIVYPPVRKWSVSAIAGVDLKLNRQFGLQVQRDLGPFTVGAWALSNKTGGVSVGFRF